ncbi:MAG: hypothetical protein A4E66_01203 [Syntrophus sp. PtaB.Bin001]|nr:MAG: hypothetical protein A4E66_01203 [Syntrophus sp. PtaB.Bin001]
MAKKSPQQFIKRQKEMERARKAKEKMAKRQQGKKEDEVPDNDAAGITDNSITE